jgi:hypothetical protein
MKMNLVSLSGRWLIAIATIVALGSWAALGQEEYSGAFYFGNSSPGGGIIGPTDVINVKLQVVAGTGNYFDCKPNNPQIQDVDGGGNVDPSDIVKIKLWNANNMATGTEGKAYSIEVLTPTFAVPAAATCSDGPRLCVAVWDNPNLSNGNPDLRYGWGVNFKVDPASECATAILCGRDPTPIIGAGGGKDQFIENSLVFQYSGMDGPGQACIRVADPGGCGGKTVTIDTYIPDDAEALYQTGTLGRFTGLPKVAGTPITGEFSFGGDPPTLITVTPDPGSVNDGATIQMTATDNMGTDVTATAVWSVISGDCTVQSGGLVTAPEGCAAYACTIEAVNGSLSDTATVNVTDNEAGTWNALSAITCAAQNDPVNPATACAVPRRISSADGCDRGPALCTWDCSGACGELCYPTLNAPYAVCCTDGAYQVCDSATVTNNETVPTMISVSPAEATLWPGSTPVDFYGWATFADGCTYDVDQLCAWTKSGGCTGATLGPYGLFTPPTSNVPCMATVTCTYNSGSHYAWAQVTTRNLIITPNPATVNDGATLRLLATDNHYGDVSQSDDITWSVTSGTCTVNNTAPNKGLVTAPEGCANTTCAVQAAFNPVGPPPLIISTRTVSVTDNEVGTWDALGGTMTCSAQIDPVNHNTACTTPNRISSIDGCNRGAAQCSWSCISGCGELCMPTLNAPYTVRCTDSALSLDAGATVINNEQIAATVNVTPEGPINLSDGQTVAFSCLATYPDGCSRSCNAALTDQAGCGVLASTLYTGAGEPCTDLVYASFDGRVDSESINLGCCLALTVTPDPVSLNDGATVRLTATDSADGDVTQGPNTTWSVMFGDCTVSNTAPDKGRLSAPEGCTNYSCIIQAVYNPGNSRGNTATVNVTDNEAGTWNALSAITCAAQNDPVNPATACAVPRRISSADGCDRGPAICVWDPTGSCGELCMPTLNGACTECCTDDAVQVCDSFTVINNETVATVNVTPEGPISKGNGQIQAFSCLGTYPDGCSRACAMTDNAGCGLLFGGTYTFAGGLPGTPCVDRVSASMDSGSDGETVISVYPCCGTAYIKTVFPLQLASGATVPQRNWSNAHVNQIITPVMSSGATSGVASSVSVNCINAGNSTDTRSLTCNLSGYPANMNIPCTPSVNFTQLSTYHCTVTASNYNGSSSKSGHMYTAEAATPTDGGHAGGYVGGLNWDSTTARCSDGTATITAVDADFNTYIPGKVYVQYAQGATVREYYASAANGAVTVPVNCQPIDYLSLSYKCGKAHCDKVEEGATVGQWKVANTRNYRYLTFTNLDATLMTERMARMGGAEFGRWKSRVTGTIDETYFTSYIYGPPTGFANSRLRSLFANPVHLRAGFALATLHGIQSIANDLDALLLAPDYEVSSSICLLARNNVGLPIAAALPPNLLLPELRRTTWTGAAACSTFTANPGIYRFEYWTFNPGVHENIWTLGAYVNAATFSVSSGIDLFGFPIHACGMGMYGVTAPADLTGDPINAIGANAGWRYDLRESWGAFTGLGYDPDAGVDRKILYSVYGNLPPDPARAGATLWKGLYRLPQMTDSALGTGWDSRFYRKNVGIVGGADFGLAAGIGITGLTLDTLIDDNQFTVFMQGYIQSTSTNKLGNRNVRPWSTGTGQTQTISIMQGGVNSTWTDPSGTNIDWTAVESGGPTNYAAIAVITRGSLTDGRSSDPDLQVAYGLFPRRAYAPGSLVGVWHVGPSEGAGTQNISIDDFLNLPTTLTQLRDEYRYPAPQWANTIGGSRPCNRNGELWLIQTAGSGDAIPKRLSDNRYYFQFTRPTMTYATSRTIHQWRVSLDETADFTGYGGVSNHQLVPKFSIKSRVEGTHGTTSGANFFQDQYARFISQGVVAGDQLWINSRRYNVLDRRVTITALTDNSTLVTAVTWGTTGTLPADAVKVRYRVIRATPKGECIIDEYDGGGPDGYTCKSNTFWTATGPATSADIRVYVPAVTEGARTLNGVTGFVPGFWEGLTNGDELKWTYSIMVYNTGAAMGGGLGGAWDWNNWDTRKEELSTQHAASDSARVIRQ